MSKSSHSRSRKRYSVIQTKKEKKAHVERLKREFEEYREKLLDEWMCKRPRGFSEDRWKRKFRPPSKKAWKEKRRIERMKAQLEHEKRTNLIPPSERYVSMERHIIPNRALPEVLKPLDLTKLSKELKAHTYLRGLYLSRCILGDDGISKLSSALRKTKSPLQILCLRSNRLTYKGSQIVFDMLKDDPPALPFLTTLGLGYNRLGAKAAKAFCELLLQQKAKSVVSTLLASVDKGDDHTSGNQPKDTLTSSAGAFHGTVKSCESKHGPCNLTTMTTHPDPLAPRTCKTRSKIRLRSLDLYYNNGGTPLRRRMTMFKSSLGLGYKGIQALSQGIAGTIVPLRSLNLWNVNMGPRGAAALADSLKITHCPITSINISGNGIKDEGTIAMAEALEQRARHPCQVRTSGPRLPLTELDISKNKITGKGVVALAAAMKLFGPVESAQLDDDKEAISRRTLDSTGKEQMENTGDFESKLRGNNQSAHSTTYINHNYRARLPIKRINLSDNRSIGDIGAKAISAALRRFGRGHPLVELDLQRIGISKQGAAEIGWALGLSRSQNFQRLRLSANNTIGDEGARALASALKITNLPLSMLELNDIGMTNAGAESLADALRNSLAPIESLQIANNRIQPGLRGHVKNWVIFRFAQDEREQQSADDPDLKFEDFEEQPDVEDNNLSDLDIQENLMNQEAASTCMQSAARKK